jgi:thymidylate synthase (FAD)
MEILKPSYKIISKIDPLEILTELERFGRVSHLSDPKTSGNLLENAKSFVKKWGIDAGHWTILEAWDLTIEFIVDRGVTHEGVRHRLTSPMQESTRYCNYSKDKYDNNINVIDIRPHFINPDVSIEIWVNAMLFAEKSYLDLLNAGESAQIARSVLPNSLKSKLNIKANLREWRWILQKRCHHSAHPQIREVMLPLLKELREKLPVIFDDLIYL